MNQLYLVVGPLKTWHNNSLKEKNFQNIQHKLLLRIQQLTTNHTVRQCTCISEEDPMFTGYFIYIYLIYYQVVCICYISLCFVAWHHIYFIFAHDWTRIFPFFVLGYRRVHLSIVWIRSTSPLWNLNAYLFFWYTLIIFAVYVWKNRYRF
jgi:hypothetical protein